MIPDRWPNCIICGKKFKPKTKNPLCCGLECTSIYKKTPEYKNHLSTVQKNRTEEEWNAICEKRLNYRQRRKEGSLLTICEICGTEFEPQKYSKRKTCSEKCKEALREKTNKLRYGNEHLTRCAKIQEKTKETMKSLYGTTSFACTREYKERSYSTKKKNKSFNSSSNEEKILLLLKTKFHGVVCQFSSENYPFHCDFYIPEKDLYIEYQGYWSHGKKPFEDTENDSILLQKWKEKLKIDPTKKQYVSAIQTWTVRDPLKRETAKKNNLNWIEFFSMKEFEEWFNSF